MKSTATAAPVANPFMKPASRMIFRLLAIVYLTVLSYRAAAAESAPSTISASDLAARLSAWQQDGSSYVRLRMLFGVFLDELEPVLAGSAGDREQWVPVVPGAVAKFVGEIVGFDPLADVVGHSRDLSPQFFKLRVVLPA